MPLHRVYAAKGIFSPEEKRAIAQSITRIYDAIPIPSFYTVVVFIDLERDSIFVGGEANARFVRIVSQHLARSYSTAEEAAKVVDLIQDAFAPYVRDRGLDWESHVEYVDREGWRENGLRPPMPKTDAEKTWIELDKPVPY
ncbi:g9913 [Coccomyxa elongata]